MFIQEIPILIQRHWLLLIIPIGSNLPGRQSFIRDHSVSQRYALQLLFRIVQVVNLRPELGSLELFLLFPDEIEESVRPFKALKVDQVLQEVLSPFIGVHVHIALVVGGLLEGVVAQSLGE